MDGVTSLADVSGVRVRLVRPGTLAKVLDIPSPQSMVGVVEQPRYQAAPVLEDAVSSSLPVLVLVDVADPGNVGTLVRSAEAFGCGAVVLVGDCADLFNPKTVRATAGAVFRMPVVAVESVATLRSLTREFRLPLVGTVGRGGSAPEEADLSRSVALLIGNEAHGLPRPVLEKCEQMVSIRMAGAGESLNAAVAGSVVMFEAQRQRRLVAAAEADTEPSGGAVSGVGHNGDSPTDEHNSTGART